MLCPECGAELGDVSWTRKDPTAMCRELGLQVMAFAFYSYATLQIHTTPTRLTSRLEEVGEGGGLRFNGGPQRSDADAALAGAHVSLALLLQHHNRYFALGLEDLETELSQDLQLAWPGQPAVNLP